MFVLLVQLEDFSAVFLELVCCVMLQYKECLVILATKWEMMLRSFGSDRVSVLLRSLTTSYLH